MNHVGLGWCTHCAITLFWDKRPGHKTLPYQEPELIKQHICTEYQKDQVARGNHRFHPTPIVDSEGVKLLIKRIEALERQMEQLTRLIGGSTK